MTARPATVYTLLNHLMEARDDRDIERLTRILSRVPRADDDFLADVETAFEVHAERESNEDQGWLTSLALLAEAAHHPRGHAVALRTRALLDDPDDDVSWEECLADYADHPERWAPAALLLLGADTPLDSEFLREHCIWAIACAPVGTELVLPTLLADLDFDATRAIEALQQHADRGAVRAVLNWCRTKRIPDLPDLDAARDCFNAMALLDDWQVELTADDRAAYAQAASLERDRLEGLNRSLLRQRRRLDREIRELQARAPSIRTLDRKHTSPNSPCACGSGRKTKKCCG